MRKLERRITDLRALQSCWFIDLTVLFIYSAKSRAPYHWLEGPPVLLIHRFNSIIYLFIYSAKARVLYHRLEGPPVLLIHWFMRLIRFIDLYTSHCSYDWSVYSFTFLFIYSAKARVPYHRLESPPLLMIDVFIIISIIHLFTFLFTCSAKNRVPYHRLESTPVLCIDLYVDWLLLVFLIIIISHRNWAEAHAQKLWCGLTDLRALQSDVLIDLLIYYY